MRSRSPKVRDAFGGDDDDDVDATPSSAAADANAALPWRNLILLTVLYVVQGLPTGLVMSSLPFLLRSRLSYAQLGIVSLASYPYALKLAWSPVVDTKFVAAFGRRKSWIVPMQIVIGGIMLLLGASIAPDLSSIGPDNASVYAFTLALFCVVLAAATQDVAVDGLAIANGVLPLAHRGLASTTQSIGLNAGYFMSFTIFLALNSAEFCNAWLRAPEHASSIGVLTLSAYCKFIAAAFFATTAYLALFFREPAVSDASAETSMAQVYAQIWHIAQLKPVRELSLIMSTCKVGFVLFDAVTTLRLLDKGVRAQDVALFALVDFPLQLLVALYASKHVIGASPLDLYRVGFFGRAAVGLLGAALVWLYPGGAPTTVWWLVLLASSLAYSTSSSLMFVSQCALFSRVVQDEAVASTYVTFINSTANFGSSWPKFIVLALVEPVGRVFGDGFFVLAALSTAYNGWFFVRMIDRLLALQRVPASAWMLRSENDRV